MDIDKECHVVRANRQAWVQAPAGETDQGEERQTRHRVGGLWHKHWEAGENQ